MHRFFLKLRRRRTLERDLEAEIAFHREMAEAGGNTTPIGNGVAIREEALDLWRFTFLENLWRDIVHGARGLLRSPALVVSAMLSLGLGIGVNAALFSLGVEFLFSRPSVADAGSLVAVRVGGNSHAKYQVVEFIRSSGLFADVAGEDMENFVNWNDGSETRRVFAVFTSENYFTMLGIPMAYGRGILPDDPNEVAVLSHRFWVRHFNGDPAVVGRAINLDGRLCTVVGVLPAAHRALTGFGFSPDLYLPRYLEDTQLEMYARLKPGMPVDAARAGLATVAQRLDEVFPERFWKHANDLKVSPVAGFGRLRYERKLRAVGLFFLLLLAVVGLVLLIACMNVASLLLARAAARRREMAIRLALGAGRGRLLQQLLVESLLLALAGAGLGLLLAHVTASALARIQLPLPIPIRLQIEPDWRVALYAAFLAVVATLASGLLPAFRSLKDSIAPDFHREPRMRLRRVLVAAQVAISVVALAAGFLFLRNLFESHGISPGFDVRRTLRADIQLPPAEYRDAARKAVFVEQGLRDLEAIPGIEAAAAARIVPFTDSTRMGTRLTFPDTGEQVSARFHWNAVTPAWFRVMDIPVLQGRSFELSDRGGERVVIVNRLFAERFLGKRQAVGCVFLWGLESRTPYRIVGVVEGTKVMTIGEEPQPQLYQPLAQTGFETRIQFVLRSATPPAAQLEPLRRALRRLEPAAGAEVSTMYSSIGLAYLPSQIGAIFLGSVGSLGLLLTAVGLYGVMVYSVARRTREIGVRMAIGASRGQVTCMVLLDAAKLIAAGSGIGLFIALFVTRPLATFLVPGLEPADPLSFLAVLVVLLATGLIASWGPARRAMAIDPATSLRWE
jgi:predicted permease